MPKTRILLVCLGNICRSPTAQGVVENMVCDAGLEDKVEIDSAGTYGAHIGESPDRRATGMAARFGYDIQNQRARQIAFRDFQEFDYILVMDNDNLQALKSQCPPKFHKKIALFLSYAKGARVQEVPDPYYGGEAGFEKVLRLIEEASQGLIEHLCMLEDSDSSKSG